MNQNIRNHAMPFLFLREDAIDMAHDHIVKAPTWSKPQFERGYFQGLTAAWMFAGVITPQELEYLRDKLDDALKPPVSQPIVYRPTLLRRLRSWLRSFTP